MCSTPHQDHHLCPTSSLLLLTSPPKTRRRWAPLSVTTCKRKCSILTLWLARTKINGAYIYDVFGRDYTKHMVIYSAYIYGSGQPNTWRTILPPYSMMWPLQIFAQLLNYITPHFTTFLYDVTGCKKQILTTSCQSCHLILWCDTLQTQLLNYITPHFTTFLYDVTGCKKTNLNYIIMPILPPLYMTWHVANTTFLSKTWRTVLPSFSIMCHANTTSRRHHTPSCHLFLWCDTLQFWFSYSTHHPATWAPPSNAVWRSWQTPPPSGQGQASVQDPWLHWEQRGRIINLRPGTKVSLSLSLSLSLTLSLFALINQALH